jgi:hypothetical protein
MKPYVKRMALAPVALTVILLILMFPGLPWSASCQHTFSRIVTKIEMKMARLRGVEPRLVAICGKSSAAGAQIQVLDSKSGWAVITDSEGRFTVPGLIWYPGATYKIVISTDDYKKPNTHVLVEVFYDMRWHLYDPTYGVTFQTKDGCLANYKELRLDARLVSGNLYRKLSDRERKRWVLIQQKILNTGYHHLYRITRDEES